MPDDQQSNHNFQDAKEYVVSPGLPKQIANIDSSIEQAEGDVGPAIHAGFQRQGQENHDGGNYHQC